MQRHGSAGSVTSVTSSSRRGEKKPLPTHMIIQRENDNRLMLLPMEHLVNSSVTRVKLNNTVTFKGDLGNRKQERGKVIQLGNEEECIDQLQMFEMIAEEVDEHNSFDNENHKLNEKETNKKRGNQSEISLPLCERLNRESDSDGSSHSIKQIKNIVKAKEALKLKYLQTRKKVMNKSTSSEEDSSVIEQRGAFHGNVSTKKSVYTSDTMVSKKKTTDTVGKELRNQEAASCRGTSTSRIIIGSQSQNKKTNLSSDLGMFTNSNIDEEEQEFNENDTDILLQYKSLSKKNKELSTELIASQTEVHRLVQENAFLKRTTMPIPDAAGRQWFINMGNFFSKKGPDTDIEKYAKALKIDARDLIECIDSTACSTVRQVVRLLYSPKELATISGPTIPRDQRLAIRQFAESQKGPISDEHKFNEAINGVFRSQKSESKQVQKGNKPLKTKPNENPKEKTNNVDKGQKTLKQMMTMSKKKDLKLNHGSVDNENIIIEENDQDNE